MRFVGTDKETKAILEKLINEATSLSSKLDALSQGYCYARYNSNEYFITPNGKASKALDIALGHDYPSDYSSLAIKILREMIRNGHDRLNIIERKISDAYELSPEVALKSTLEGKNKPQIIDDLLNDKKGQLFAIINSIKLPEQIINNAMNINITVGILNPRSYVMTLKGSNGKIDHLYINKTSGILEVLDFLNDFNEVKRQFKGIVSKILKGVPE